MPAVYPRESKTAGKSPAVSVSSARWLCADLALQSLLEPLDLAGRVDDRLLPRVERMAVAADVDAQLGPGRTDRPLGAARAAVDLGFEILGMDIGLHEVLLRRRPRRAVAQPVVAGQSGVRRSRRPSRPPRPGCASCSWWRART